MFLYQQNIYDANLLPNEEISVSLQQYTIGNLFDDLPKKQ
jgi:hypothetical protein